MKRKIFNIVAYTFIVIALLSFLYTLLPPEYQHEQLTYLTAGILGLATTAGGTSMLAFSGISDKTKNDLSGDFKVMYDKFNTLQESNGRFDGRFDGVDSKVDNLVKIIVKLNDRIDSLERDIEENNKLQRANLEARKENPFMPVEAKEKIEGVLNEKEE